MREKRVILSDVNFTVDKGDFIAITGPNGGGKTTLLRLILGLLKPTEGSIVFCDESGKPCQPPAIGDLPQKNSVDSHFPITVREVVLSGLLAQKGMDKSLVKERVDELLEAVGLTELVSRPIGALSGGQLQRALFARAIARRPQLLVLDEPLSYLDKTFEKRLYKIVAEIAKNTTILLVSHEMSEIGGMANRHIIIDRRLEECTARHHYVPREC
ncbi:MAG: ATP-binding cassette domain-containing protein [Muribaculaceae bacterium]|nr:ATP-binding cassette domain-containing protein [Muribaculaceae bacterium]